MFTLSSVSRQTG